MFIDGDRITAGSENCNCGPECEFPCWQRVGWAKSCRECGCPDFPPDIDDDQDQDAS